MTKRFLICLGVLAAAANPAGSADSRTILITQKDVDAARTLLHLEDSALHMDGRKGEFMPPPGLRFLGLKSQSFEIKTDFILKLSDLRLRDINSRDATLTLKNDALELQLDIEDAGTEITSRLGTIDGTGLAGIARIRFDSRSDGTQKIAVAGVRIAGQFKGTGLLAPRDVVERARKLAEDLLAGGVTKALETKDFQARLQESLLIWAGFSTGEAWLKIAPGSIRIQSGILAFTATR